LKVLFDLADDGTWEISTDSEVPPEELELIIEAFCKATENLYLDETMH